MKSIQSIHTLTFVVICDIYYIFICMHQFRKVALEFNITQPCFLIGRTSYAQSTRISLALDFYSTRPRVGKSQPRAEKKVNE